MGFKMKKTALTLAFILASGPALAGPLTCYYDAQGNSMGADGGNSGLSEGQYETVVVPDNFHGGSHSYIYVLPSYNSGNDCPSTVTVPN
jgi:hypothetical protein